MFARFRWFFTDSGSFLDRFKIFDRFKAFLTRFSIFCPFQGYFDPVDSKFFDLIQARLMNRCDYDRGGWVRFFPFLDP